MGIFGWSYPPGCSGPPEEPDNDETLVVSHQGMAYVIDPKDDPPLVTYIDDLKDPEKYNTYWTIYRLEGAHQGPPIVIEIENPRMEPGSYGGYYVDYDRVRWADDKSKFNGDLWDIYSDAVREDMRDWLCQR